MPEKRSNSASWRAGDAQAGHLPGRWLAPLSLMALVAVLASGCAASRTELPSLEKDKRQLLSTEEQKKAIATISKKADADAAAAKQQIEGKSN